MKLPFFAVAALAAAVSSFAYAAAPEPLRLWSRKAGNHSLGFDVAGVDAETIDAAPASRSEAVRFDPHLGRTRSFRGVDLRPLLARAAARGDLALLHFANGMIIPMRTNEDEVAPIAPFLAFATKGDDGVWRAGFAPVARERDLQLDPRPLVFFGNKVVVKAPGNAWLSSRTLDPWRYADSLTGIEIVDERAYLRQITPAAPNADVERGLAVFRGRCVFCHAARGIGGRYGWDFLDPLPIDTLKDADALWLQVTTRHLDAAEAGLAMPTQRDLSHDDARALWSWIRALAAAPRLAPYAPPSG